MWSTVSGSPLGEYYQELLCDVVAQSFETVEVAHSEEALCLVAAGHTFATSEPVKLPVVTLARGPALQNGLEQL